MDHYARLTCKGLSAISLVWNNQNVSPQTVFSTFQNRDLWKVPIYIYSTPFNSMLWRYKIPQLESSEVFFSVDDDIVVDCIDLEAGFEEWRRNAIGSIGPFVAFEVRTFFHQPKKPQFVYNGRQSQFFTIPEAGAAFISRDFLELFYFDLPEFIDLRNFVQKINNCDDIFFIGMVLHLYEQLLPVYMKPISSSYKNTDPQVGQVHTKDVYKIRNECINYMSQRLGYNPLRYVAKTRVFGLWTDPGRNNTIKSKRVIVKSLEKHPNGNFSEQVIAAARAELYAQKNSFKNSEKNIEFDKVDNNSIQSVRKQENEVRPSETEDCIEQDYILEIDEHLKAKSGRRIPLLVGILATEIVIVLLALARCWARRTQNTSKSLQNRSVQVLQSEQETAMHSKSPN